MNDRIDILGVGIDVVTHNLAVDRASAWLQMKADRARHIVTANPEMIMQAHDDKQVARTLSDADLVVADGIGIVWASRLLKKTLPQRVAGIDLAMAILERAAALDVGVFLFGAKPGVAEEAAANLRRRIRELRIVGVQHGFFSPDEEEAIVQRIQSSGAGLVLVALGVPRQELWIARHRARLSGCLLIGVGGALDGYAGRVRRAPRWTQKLGLEWAYRLAREPRRIGRMAALPRFASRVLRTVVSPTIKWTNPD